MGTTASSRTGIRSDRAAGKLPPAGLGKLRPSRRNEAAAARLVRDARRSVENELAHNELAIKGEAGDETLEQCVRRSLDRYFVDLDGAKPHALHDMVLQAVERPLLRFAMEKSGGNQSAAALLLGINRNTLRKKLAEYGLGSRETPAAA